MRIGKIPTVTFWTAVLTVVAGGTPALPAQSHPVLPRIAVLPLEHADGNAAGPDLGFGLAAEVTHWLFYVPGIIVRPMSAVTDSRRKPGDLESLARELDVNHLLTGTLRVSASHYDVEYRLHRWTGEVSHLPSDARSLKPSIEKDSEKSRFSKGMLPSSSSYLVFLKALSSIPKTDDEKEQRLRALETVARQSDYPPMVALLGRLYLDRAGEIGGRGPYYPLAEETLKRAFELDPDFPPARELLASLIAKRGRSERTVALMQEGLVRHPTYAGFHKTLGYVLRYGGLMDESIAAYQRAQELDGSFANLVSTQDQITKSFIYQGDYEKAIASHRKMLSTLERMQQGPDEKQIFYEGVIHLYAGQKEQAAECFERAADLDPDSVWTTFGLAYHGMTEGDKNRVTEIVERLERRVVVDGERHYRLVHFCAFLGRAEKALEHLQTSIESGFFNSPYIRNDPFWVSLYDLLRFKELLRAAEGKHKTFRKLFSEQ